MAAAAAENLVLQRADDDEGPIKGAKHATYASGYRGVHRCGRTGHYHARISVGGRTRWVGSYATAEEAALRLARLFKLPEEAVAAVADGEGAYEEAAAAEPAAQVEEAEPAVVMAEEAAAVVAAAAAAEATAEAEAEVVVAAEDVVPPAPAPVAAPAPAGTEAPRDAVELLGGRPTPEG